MSSETHREQTVGVKLTQGNTWGKVIVVGLIHAVESQVENGERGADETRLNGKSKLCMIR